MSHVHVSYQVESCRRCGKQLLKVSTGGVVIGSPLIECPRCGTIGRSSLRKEWHEYPQKTGIFLFPVILYVMPFIIGMFMDEMGMRLAVPLANYICLPVGAIWLLVQGFRIIASKRRMKNADYLRRLRDYHVISEAEFEQRIRQPGIKY